MKKVLIAIVVAVMALVFAPQQSQAGEFRITYSSGGHYYGHYYGGHRYYRQPRYCPPPRYYYCPPPRRGYYRRPVRVYRVAPPVYYTPQRSYYHGRRYCR